VRIVISEFMDDAAVADLARRFDVRYDKDLVDRPEALRAGVRDADALIVRNRTQVDAALLAAAPKLRVVGRLGVGLDNIDVSACTARGVEVLPATGANAQAVAEYVIAAAMLLRRRAYAATAEVGAGRWPRAALSDGRELGGATLGLIGFGGIGRLAGRLGRALGMRTIAFDAQIAASANVWRDEDTRAATLDQVLAESNVVSLHVPLTAETRNLIDASRLATMKPDAVLINTSRGGVVDEAALAAALRAGRLAGAALDVFATEPLPEDSPLWELDNVLISPHTAALSVHENERIVDVLVENLHRFLDGRPLRNVVDVEHFY
jgi:(S)-sulfolactate dehydrogenase